MSTGKVKQLAFSEGVTVGTPSEIASQSVGFASYASEAAFVSAEGTAAAGDAFYDTTVQAVKYYNGSSWSVIGAGGAGEKNYIEAPSTATGWSNVGDLDVATTTTAADLPREYTTGSGIKITADSNTQSTADYVYYDFTLDDVDLNKKLKISWSQKTTGTYAAGDLAVVVTTQADRTTALHTPITTAIPAADGTFTTSFDSGSTATLSLVIRATTDMTTNGGIVISDVVVGPGIQPQGAVVGAWQSFTPTWTNITVGNGTQEGTWRRVGDTIEVAATINFGTTTSVGGNIAPVLPSSLTRVAPSSLNLVIGSFLAYDADVTTFFTGVIQNQTSGILLVADDVTSAAAVNATVPFTWSAAGVDSLRIEYSVAVSEWAGSGTLNVAQNDVEYASNSTTADTDDTTSFAYGPSGSALPGTLTQGRNKRVRFQTSFQETDSIALEVQIGGSGNPWLPVTGYIGTGPVQELTVQNAKAYGLSARRVSGSTTDVDVQFGQYAASTGATFDSAGTAWGSVTASSRYRVKKISGGQAVGFGNVAQSSAGLVKSAGQLLGTNTNDSAATGYVGEYLSTTLTYASRNGLVTNTTENVTGSAITLTAGDWDVQGVVAFEAAAATITNLSVGVSLTSATLPSSTTLAVPTSGEIYLAQAMATSVSGVGGVMTIPTYRVSVSASTPLYLVARAIFSAGTVECYGHVSARRVR